MTVVVVVVVVVVVEEYLYGAAETESHYAPRRQYHACSRSYFVRYDRLIKTEQTP